MELCNFSHMCVRSLEITRLSFTKNNMIVHRLSSEALISQISVHVKYQAREKRCNINTKAYLLITRHFLAQPWHNNFPKNITTQKEPTLQLPTGINQTDLCFFAQTRTLKQTWWELPFAHILCHLISHHIIIYCTENAGMG